MASKFTNPFSNKPTGDQPTEPEEVDAEGVKTTADEAELDDEELEDGEPDDEHDKEEPEEEPAPTSQPPSVKRTGLDRVIPSKREAAAAFALTAGLAVAGATLGIGPALGAIAGMGIYSTVKSYCVMRRWGKSDRPVLQKFFGNLQERLVMATACGCATMVLGLGAAKGVQGFVDDPAAGENNLRRYVASSLVVGEGLFSRTWIKQAITVPKTGEVIKDVTLRYQDRGTPQNSVWVYKGYLSQSFFATGVSVSVEIPANKVRQAKNGGLYSVDNKYFERQLTVLADYAPSTGAARFMDGWDRKNQWVQKNVYDRLTESLTKN